LPNFHKVLRKYCNWKGAKMGYGRRSEWINGREVVLCTRCKQHKPVSEFNLRTPLLHLYQYYCRSCQAEIDKVNHAAEKTKKLSKIQTTSDDGMEIRWCSRCEQWKPLNEFNMKNGSRGLLQNVCRSCQHERDREHYLANSQRVQRNNKAAKIKNRVMGQEHLYKILSMNKCADCGTTDPAVLTFDHVKGQKKYNIASMISRGFSLDALKTEIEKTEVVCFNCHMKREQKRRSLFRSLWGKK
jgi:hypothetical protein